MRQRNILVWGQFARSKVVLDFQHNKLCIRVTSGEAEELKTQDLRKLENNRKISKLIGGNIVRSFPSRSKTLASTAKNYAETDIKVSWPRPILPYLFSLSL